MNQSHNPARDSAIYAALANIPAGKVTTYGRVAELAGLVRGARIVGKTLCHLPQDSTLPWHRVINARGYLSLPPDSAAYHTQYHRLQNEGVEIINGKINLRRFGFFGD